MAAIQGTLPQRMKFSPIEEQSPEDEILANEEQSPESVFNPAHSPTTEGHATTSKNTTSKNTTSRNTASKKTSPGNAPQADPHPEYRLPGLFARRRPLGYRRAYHRCENLPVDQSISGNRRAGNADPRDGDPPHHGRRAGGAGGGNHHGSYPLSYLPRGRAQFSEVGWPAHSPRMAAPGARAAGGGSKDAPTWWNC